MTGAGQDVPLSSLGQIVTGSTPPAAHPDWFANTGTPFITPSDIQDGTRSVRTTRFLSEAGTAAMVNRLLPTGAICLVSIGSTIGKMCTTTGPSITNQQINSLVVDERIADPTFVFYAISQRAYELKSIASGSATPILNKSAFSSVTIHVLPLAQQRLIGAILGALDDKIESNRRLGVIIPQLIRAMVSESLGVNRREVAVADLATFVNGGAYTKGSSGTGRVVIRIAELNSGPGGSTVYNNINVPDEKIARAGDILMSWSGSLGVYRWFRAEAIINQHIFKVIPSNGYPSWLVFDRLDAVMPTFQGIAKDKATTMGHIQRGHLESTTIEVPTPAAIRHLDGLIAPLWDRLLLAERETVDLTAFRDALLAELLSGRIRVSEAEGVVA